MRRECWERPLAARNVGSSRRKLLRHFKPTSFCRCQGAQRGSTHQAGPRQFSRQHPQGGGVALVVEGLFLFRRHVELQG